MFSVELPGGLKITADTLEEADSATVHFSRLISRKEMASIAGVGESTIDRWINERGFPRPAARLCDFLAALAKPLSKGPKKSQ